MGNMPDFISLNGPDNAGKTTQLHRLAARRNSYQLLGAVHEHDPEPWQRVAGTGYAAWWFERSTTVELTGMLVTGHLKRAAARQPDRTGLLDRGLPMLLAVAAATCSLKDGLSVREALLTVASIAKPFPAPAETSVLLMPALDPERSYAISSSRQDRRWTGIYPAYQRALHEVLLRQADQGRYATVVDCEGLPPDEVHARVIEGIAADTSGRHRTGGHR